MELKDFFILFPNKVPYGYLPVEIKNNVVHCVKIKDVDLIKKVEELKF